VQQRQEAVRAGSAHRVEDRGALTIKVMRHQEDLDARAARRA